MGCGGSKDMVKAPDHNSQKEQDDATGGLSEAYEVKHLLGSGSAGDTWLCRDRVIGELVAVKLMKRPIPPMMGTNIMREIKIGAALGKGHLNIVKPREVVLTRTHMGLVMDYVAGGNMADYILKTILLKFGSFDTRDGLVMEEDEARYFFQQIISAVDYCHRNQVAHRDLKMDNTLLDDNDPPRIKLCDFGFAKWWDQVPNMSTITGTPDYMSPQLLGPKAQNKKALYDGTKADVWASGVLLCVMLIGRFPFEGIEMSNATNLEEVSAHVWNQQNRQRWCDNPIIAQDCTMLSSECIDLLSRMFELDESKRISVAEIRAHPWMKKPLPPLYSAAMEQLEREQAAIDRQVASGAFVSKDRDAALKQMIYLAASRHDPMLEASEAAAAAATGSSPGTMESRSASSDLKNAATSLRKISLTAIKPYEYTTVTHVDLRTISNFFKAAGGSPDDQDSTGHGGTEAKAALAAAAAAPPAAATPAAAAAAPAPSAANSSHAAASSSHAANGTAANGAAATSAANGAASTSAANGAGSVAHANGSPQVPAGVASGANGSGAAADGTLQSMREPTVLKAAAQQHQPHAVSVDEVQPMVP